MWTVSGEAVVSFVTRERGIVTRSVGKIKSRGQKLEVSSERPLKHKGTRLFVMSDDALCLL